MAHARSATLKNSRVLALGLALGVVAFWGSTWFTTGGGTEPLGGPGPLAQWSVWIWLVVAIPAFAGALHFKQRAVGKPGPRRLLDPGTPPVNPARVQTQLIIAQALAEGPALIGGVLFLLTGSASLPGVVLPVYALGVWVTWPRAEWFGLD